MTEVLESRLAKEFGSYSANELELNLTYTDRRHLKAHDAAAVAGRMLPLLERRLRWARAYALLGAALLALGAVGTALVGTDVMAGTQTLAEWSYPLFITFLFGFGAVTGMWGAVGVERKRVLCELGLAEGRVDETKRPAAG